MDSYVVKLCNLTDGLNSSNLSEESDVSVINSSCIFGLNNSNIPRQPRTVPQLPISLIIVTTIFYAAIFIMGTIGNVLVILVVSINKDMKNSTNYYLANLSAADLLVLTITMPSSLMDLYTKEVWYLGEFMCKFVPFLECSVTEASILTIIAISLERYYAICRPLSASYKCTCRRTVKVLLFIWFVAFFIASPFFLIAFHKSSRLLDGTPIKVCRLYMRTFLPRLYAAGLTFISYLLPLILLIVVYGIIARDLMSKDNNPATFISAKNLKARKQVVTMLLVVVALFFGCHLPYRTVSLVLIFDKNAPYRLGFKGYHSLLASVRVFFYVYSTVNPIVYSFMSSKFRKAFQKVLYCNRKQSSHRRLHHSRSFSTTRSWVSYSESRSYNTVKMVWSKSFKKNQENGGTQNDGTNDYELNVTSPLPDNLTIGQEYQ